MAADIVTLPPRQSAVATSALHNISDLARRYDVSRGTIRNWMKKGWLPTKRGFRRRVKSAEIAKPDQSTATHCQSAASSMEPASTVATAATSMASASPAMETIATATSMAERWDGLSTLTLSVAIVLAAVAAYFSVTGMARIFPGSMTPILAMASVMECGKLASAAWLSHRWKRTPWWLRPILIAIVITLAAINAVGVYGQLSAAHLDPHTDAVASITTRVVEVDAKIAAQEQLIADDERQIGQIDTAIDEAAKRGRSATALDLQRAQQERRETLVANRTAKQLVLAGLKTKRSEISGEQQKASADIGVLEYAASLLGVDGERMVSWLILAMVLSCDPLSLALVIAVFSGAVDRKEETREAELATALPRRLP
jgi:hypothetical protein